VQQLATSIIALFQAHPLARFALRALVTVVLVVWVLLSVDIQSVGALVQQAHLGWLLLGFGIFLLGMIVTAWRWQILLGGLGIRQPLPRLVHIFFVSFFFSMFLPSSIGGDVARMVLLNPEGSRRADIVSSVLADRLIGLAVIIVGGLLAVLALPALRDNPQLMGTLLLIGGAFVAGMALFINRSLLVWLARLLPRNLRAWLAGPLTQVYASLMSFRHSPGALGGAVATSVLLQIATCLSVYCAGVAFDVDASVLAYFALVPVGLAITALPISINGLGVQDQAMLVLFGAVGVAAPQALALSLYMHLLRNAVGIIGGILLIGARINVRQVQEAAQEPVTEAEPHRVY
jgi:hypothetical protein